MNIGLMGCNTAVFAEREHALALVREAEAAGVESLWAVEHVVVPDYESRYPYASTGRMPGGGEMTAITDPLGWIAFAAAVSERLKLGTGILILPLHNPLVVAKLAATVDRLAGGRLLLGVGVGWLKEEFDALGVPWAGRGARTDEYVEAMRALWRDEEATFDGEYVGFERTRCLPGPMRSSGVPIVVGGHTEAAARRAGRLGDGFFPAATPERLAELLPVMRRAAEVAGRDPDAVEVSVSVARVDVGTAARYAALGVERVIVNVPTFDPSRLRDALGRLHDELLSRV